MTEQELEKKLSNVYRRASEETRQKLDDYTKTFERLDAQRKATLSEADYKEWRKRQITTGKRWEAVSNSLAMDVLKADNEARDIINDFVPEAFADGYNFSCYQMAQEMGDNYVKGTFTLYDKKAVERLVRDNPDLLPQLKENSKTAEDIRTGKIIRWNKEKINSEVTQGIIQGESIGKIAKRMENVVGMEERSAIRNARTATNGARNAGKEESFEDAEELGIEVLQMWVASVDDRTRYEHRQLDGQTVKTGEKFHVDGFEIAYPCDPTADPSMVYNCRCTVIPYLPKYNKEKPDPHPTVSDKAYEEWKKEQPVKGDNSEEPSKTPLEKATNRQEAKQVLKDAGFGNVTKGVDNIDEKLFVANANRLSELNKRFGAIPEGMTMRMSNTDALANVNGTWNKNKEYVGTKELRLSTNWFNSDPSGLRKELDYEEKIGYSMPTVHNKYDVATLTHEYGHILQNHILEEEGATKGTYEEYREVMNELNNEIIAIAVENNPDFDADTLQEQLSEYGFSNGSEFFAECFMNSQCGKPNELGNAMNIWLERRGY